ncbi:hypothetical protein CRUP_012226 [Coryphaenoides rupestris]|nr:hypothetical protein CRUP_012226 [Coryphaenoides rupestris]
MQALEKQVGELRIDLTNESYEAALGDAGDSRPSSDTGSSWAYSSERPTAMVDPLTLNEGDLQDLPATRTTLPRSSPLPTRPSRARRGGVGRGDLAVGVPRGAEPGGGGMGTSLDKACHAPLYSPSRHAPDQLKTGLLITFPWAAEPNPPSTEDLREGHDSDRHASRKCSTKTSRSQSENSLLGQRGLPERRYSTTERPQGRRDLAHNPGQGSAGNSRRWCSNLELSQDEGESQASGMGRGPRRPPRRPRHGHAVAGQSQPHAHHHHQHLQQSHNTQRPATAFRLPRESTSLSGRGGLCQGGPLRGQSESQHELRANNTTHPAVPGPRPSFKIQSPPMSQEEDPAISAPVSLKPSLTTSALQNSPWGLMQALEKQVGELRIDLTNESYEAALGDAGDSRPSSGFYESSEGHSPKELCYSTEPTDTGSSWAYSSERPTAMVDPLTLNEGDLQDLPATRTTLPRSFSAPYPPLEGIAEEVSAEETWQWESHGGRSQEEEHGVSEEDYQRALRVEGYILGLIQQHTASPSRPCQPRTNLNPDLLYGSHKKTLSHAAEPRATDLSLDPESPAWGCDLLQGEAPSLEEDCYLALPYPHPRPLSLAGGLPPPPLPSLHPSCDTGTLNLCYRPQSPLHPPSPQSLTAHNTQDLVCAQYIPGQGCHAPLYSPSRHAPDQLKTGLLITSPGQPNQPTKHRGSKKSHDSDRHASRKCSTKTSRSQSENSLLGQRGLPERRYSTTERPQGRRDLAHNPGQGSGGNSRRWCSNLELSQDEGESQASGMGRGPRRPPRRPRHGHAVAGQSQPHAHHHHQHLQQSHNHNAQPQHSDYPERAPLCREEGGYARAAPAGESESSMSEMYSPASSSLSSDSDESGGLVWPQQLPPRLAPSSSSSSSSPQASANNTTSSSQPKAFVKIKASHALKKKILRFRSGSLKVMTTV